MECVPANSDAVENAAWPDALSVTTPIGLPPSVNVTVPVGVPLIELTVTVKVSGCPNRDGLRFDARVVVVPKLFTTWFRGLDMLVLKLVLPL